MTGFPFLAFLALPLLRMRKRFLAPLEMTVWGRGFMRLCVIMAGFARRFLDDGFPVFRSSLMHRFAANEKDFSLRSK